MTNKGSRSGSMMTCIKCKKLKYLMPSRIKRNEKYCSKSCWYKDQSVVQSNNPKYIQSLNKARSKIEYGTEKRKLRYSINTKKAWADGRLKKRIGKDNNLWKGGISSVQNIERHSSKYIEWRKSVFERDKYTCQKCGQIGKDLHAHHIKTFSKYPELRYNQDNGLTLCVKCHSKEHNRVIPNIGKINKK